MACLLTGRCYMLSVGILTGKRLGQQLLETFDLLQICGRVWLARRPSDNEISTLRCPVHDFPGIRLIANILRKSLNDNKVHNQKYDSTKIVITKFCEICEIFQKLSFSSATKFSS